MGRKRKDGDPLGLAGTRLSFRHGAFYYRHRDGRWERVGTDVAAAKSRAGLFNDPGGVYGTVGYWLDMFLVDCEARVKAKDLAERTLSDYTKDVKELKVFFGAMLPEHIEPLHVQQYLDLGKENERPVRANRERACLSSCLSWLIRTGKTTMKVNPCMQQSGVKGNAESKRDRYVTHDEYREVHAAAGTQVRLLMDLTYRTLQRPESDIIGWTPAVLARDPRTQKRVLHFKQGKTGAWLKIAMTPDLEQLITRAMGDPPRIDQTLVHTLKGHKYTYTGIMSMLTKAIGKVNAVRLKAKKPLISAFGYRDLKGKGATDMWLSGVPIEQIQALCGHADKSTTEKYIKARWHDAAMPNIVAMV